MAIDRVTIWRNAPSVDIALDNELFLEAQQSQFLQKDFALTASVEVPTLELVITQPSIVIGSLSFTGDVYIRFTDLLQPIPPEGYHCTYSGYRDNNTGAQHNEVGYTATLLVDSQRATIFCHTLPGRTAKSHKMTLSVTAVNAGTKLLAGSYLKIL